MVHYLDRYGPDQTRRHDATPGIPGWAQAVGLEEPAFYQ